MIQVAVAFGQAHSLIVKYVKEFFNQEVPSCTVSSLAGLVSAITEGQRGFSVGIML